MSLEEAIHPHLEALAAASRTLRRDRELARTVVRLVTPYVPPAVDGPPVIFDA